jgi:hypothetical protein
MAPPEIAAPAVITFEPPAPVTADELGQWLLRRRFALSYRSGYLRRRNLMQVCLLGDVRRSSIAALAAAIDQRLGTAERPNVGAR